MDFYGYFTRIGYIGDKKLDREIFLAELFIMLFLVSIVIQSVPQQKLVDACLF